MIPRGLLLAAVLIFTASLVSAAEKQAEANPQSSEKAVGQGKETSSRQADTTPSTIKMEQVEIRGEFENPDVFYIIPRRKAEMDLGSLSMDYSKDITTPMVQHVFEAQHSKDGQK